MIPFFSARHVEAAVTPKRAYDAVRDAFVAHARGEWTMHPKPQKSKRTERLR